MPHINDRLAENQQTLQRERRARIPERASRFLFEPEPVMRLLRQRLVGQDPVLEAIGAMLRVVKADIGAPQRPLAVNLFIGPTGVGKTETVRLLAQAIHGRPDALCRIDMNTLAQEHYAAALTGAPPGYVGSKEGHTLFDTEAVQGSFGKPGIVLFDELEKASPEVIRALLNVLDNGRLTLSAGTRSLDFRNALIFMTSNVGAREVARHRARYRRGWRRGFGLRPRGEARLLERALREWFDPEFLNRIDRVLTFRRLDRDWLEPLLDIELEALAQRLSRRQASLEVDAGVRAFLCGDHDSDYGARHLARRLRTHLEPPLARALLDCPEHDDFLATMDGQEVVVVATESMKIRHPT